MQKQILLIQPPVEDFYTTDCRTQPIGLGYLAASIKNKISDVSVIIYDALSNGKKRSIPWPPEFEYLKRYYGVPDKSPFKLFQQYYRFGKSNDEIKKDLEKYNPFLIGISSLFTPYYRQSLQVAEICRKILPNAKIVMGGNHATAEPHSLLTPSIGGQPLCDFVIPGEGEILIVELINHLLNPGEIPMPVEILQAGKFKQGDAVMLRTPDIDTIPFPDFGGLVGGEYHYNRQPMSFLITSRGCPYRCSFCGIHSVFGRKYRRRNNRDILREIQELANRGIRHIDIEDDHFTANKNETLELLAEIIDLKLPVTFSAMNGLVYWTLDEVLLDNMKAAGFSTLNLSLVSRGGNFYRDSARPNEVEKFRKLVYAAFERGFFITAYFILGRPGQTIEEIIENIRFLAELPVLVGASPYYLSPGTPDFELFGNGKSPGIISASEKKDPFASARLTAMDIETREFCRDEIFTIFRLGRVINHIKKGLDMSFKPGHDFYKEALIMLESRKQKSTLADHITELPVSNAVIEKLRSKPLVVAGYKSLGSYLIKEQQ